MWGMTLAHFSLIDLGLSLTDRYYTVSLTFPSSIRQRSTKATQQTREEPLYLFHTLHSLVHKGLSINEEPHMHRIPHVG